MKHFNRAKLFHSKAAVNILILAVSAALLYSIISLYFCFHFFLHTEINGVNVSLKSKNSVAQGIRDYTGVYQLQLTERNGGTEKISGQEIKLQLNENEIPKIYQLQNSFQWVGSLFQEQRFEMDALYSYDETRLIRQINALNCLTEPVVQPKNVSFKYSNGSYEPVKEVYGTVIRKTTLVQAVKRSIENGCTHFDLEENQCYENPTYTLNSFKTHITQNLLNKYASTQITYRFGSEDEILNGSTVNKWLGIDGDLDVVINKTAVKKYVSDLSRKYDTVGTARDFKTSTGKTVTVKGGLYGWKIDQNSESEALYENIIQGDTITKEPVYSQKAFSRGENEIGSTYLEINITKQHVWFYVNGVLVVGGAVVTGNPYRGWSTVTGLYMLNYKQKGATLVGQGYESAVTYWMPFYGNIGLHDASWRSSFGGEIYKQRGTHGCVNAPFYLAKTIFEKIEEGTPIVCYEEA